LPSGTLKRARSRADGAPGSVLAGGLYFLTSALSRFPLDSTTEICGVIVTLTLGRTLSSTRRLTASSASGLSPPWSPAAVSAEARHAVVTARWAIWFTSQRGVSWAGWTTWPLVMTQPDGSMNQPVPVSLNEGGVMVWTLPPQLRD